MAMEWTRKSTMRSEWGRASLDRFKPRLAVPDPLHAVIADDGDGRRRRVEAEERPRARDERIAVDDASRRSRRRGRDRRARSGWPSRDVERLGEDLVGRRERIHADAPVVGVARVLEPLDHRLGPADADVRRGQHLERRAPAVEGEPQASRAPLARRSRGTKSRPPWQQTSIWMTSAAPVSIRSRKPSRSGSCSPVAIGNAAPRRRSAR